MLNVPQTLASETSAAINALIAESDRFRKKESAEIQKLFGELRKLQKIDARQAFVHYGAVAAICGDVDDTLEYFRKALQHPGEAETKHEFWTSLVNLGLYDRAQEVGRWLLDPRRGFYPEIWGKAVSSGLVLEVWRRLPEAKKTYPDLSEVDFSAVEQAATVMGAYGLTDNVIGSVFDLMGEIQRAHRIMFAGKRVFSLKVIRPPEDPAYLYFALPLDAGVDEVHGMNRELASLVVERLPEGVFPQGTVCTFEKAHPIELRAAA